MLFPGVFEGLVAQHVERPANAPARAVRQDYLVNVTALGGDERVGEAALILVDAGLDLFGIF